MKTTRTVKCHICDKIVNAQGLGGHLRLKHGIVEYKTVSTSSTQVQHKSTQVKPELDVSSTQVQPELITQVKRAGDYVKKNDAVLRSELINVFAQPNDKLVCWHCNSLMNLNDSRIPDDYKYKLIKDSNGKVIKREIIAGWCPDCKKVMSTKASYYKMK